jgi:serine/threonine-protein kinase PknK
MYVLGRLMSVPTVPGFSDFALIGEGGSATVYAALQEDLGRRVAVKVLDRAEFDEQALYLFDAERKALGKFAKHPNVVMVFATGRTDAGDPLLVMELCASGSLFSLVQRAGPLSIEEVIRVGLKMSEALQIAHEEGMVHRDVKPENILVSDRGEPVLSDFGISAVFDNEHSGADGAMSPLYVAPEIVSGARPSSSTDLYSLGSTLFFLLTGRAPHQKQVGESLGFSEALARAVDLQYPLDLPSTVYAPQSSKRALQSILVKDPRRRLDDASKAAELFRAAEIELGTIGRPVQLRTNLGAQDGSPKLQIDPDATEIRPKGSKPPGPFAAPAKPEWSLNPSGSQPVASWPGSSSTGDRAHSAEGLSGHKTVSVPFDPSASPVAGENRKNGGKPLRRPLLIALGMLLLSVATVSFFFRNAKVVETVPVSVGATDTLAPPPLSAPQDVRSRVLDNHRVEVMWAGSSDTRVTYRMLVFRGNERFKTIPTESSPATIDGLDIVNWLPCFEVTAIDSVTGNTATADRVCAESPTA